MVVDPLTARGAGGVLGGISALSGIAQTVGALIFVWEIWSRVWGIGEQAP